jgi:hypothetical protein
MLDIAVVLSDGLATMYLYCIVCDGQPRDLPRMETEPKMGLPRITRPAMRFGHGRYMDLTIVF